MSGVPDEFAGGPRSGAARLGPLASRVQWFDLVGSTNDRALNWAETRRRGRLPGAGRRAVGGAGPAGARVGIAGRRRHLRQRRISAAGAGSRAADDGRRAAPCPKASPAATGLETQVKWPNDVCVDPGAAAKAGRHPGRGGSAGERVLHVILGLGINVMPAAYPPEVAARATLARGRARLRSSTAVRCWQSALAAPWRRCTMLGTPDEGLVLDRLAAARAATSGRASSGMRRSGLRIGTARDVGRVRCADRSRRGRSGAADRG